MPDIIDLSSDDEEYEGSKSFAHKKQKDDSVASLVREYLPKRATDAFSDEHVFKPGHIGGQKLVAIQEPQRNSVIGNNVLEDSKNGHTTCCERASAEASSALQNHIRLPLSGQVMGNGSSHMEKPTPCSSSEAAKSSQEVLPNGKFSRHFWRAGEYQGKPCRPKVFQGTMDHVRVHPKFLHSNATSHKWALGAIAELLDNAIDEVHNGATFVNVDKIINPRDSSPALLVQDNGGGMDPDCMRHCMSLGYSRKNTSTMIGQYGNGFKTSTMRLGADVIVFSRCSRNGYVTQSIGLLSYTFLRETGHEDTVVPMVDFEIHPNTQKPRKLLRSTEDAWSSNLSTILQWSPYTSKSQLLKQFEDISSHGTKIVVYNLWLNDDGILELDFDSDATDIQLRGSNKQEKPDKLQSQLTQQHISNRLRYSLRAYASMLYLEMPSKFQIVLRGTPIEHHCIASDLKFPQYIVYKPQIGGSVKDVGTKEVSVITTIGFTKEAPMVNVHGFNVYHKNRLIMPFWKVLQENTSRGRGVVGVLEANFIEPAHDKQDFEKTALLLRLETRLKQMTIEYWNLHCELIGYQRSTPRNRQVVDAGYPAAGFLPTGPAYMTNSAVPPTFVTAGASGAVSQATGVIPNNNFQYQQQMPLAVPVFQGAPAVQDGSMTQVPASDVPEGSSRRQQGENREDLEDRPNSNATISQLHRSSESARGWAKESQLDAPESNGLVKVKSEFPDDISFKRKIVDSDLVHAEDAKKQRGGETIRSENYQTSTNQVVNEQVNESRPTIVKGLVALNATQDNILKIVEENTLLKSRCADYQCREKELEQMVDRLERELLESKAKYIEVLTRFDGKMHSDKSAGENAVPVHHVKQEAS